MPDTLVMKEKRKYRGKQKVKSIGYVVGGNELILKTSLKKFNTFECFIVPPNHLTSLTKY